MATRIAWRLPTIAPSYLSSSLLRKQLCTTESIRRRHGTLFRLTLPISQSKWSSPTVRARSLTSTNRLRSSQHLRNPPNVVRGSWKVQHRSSSSNGGPNRLPDAKTTEINQAKSVNSNNGNVNPENTGSLTMWQKFLAPKPMPERYSASWYREIVLICTVFAITGSTTMIVRILIYVTNVQ